MFVKKILCTFLFLCCCLCLMTACDSGPVPQDGTDQRQQYVTVTYYTSADAAPQTVRYGVGNSFSAEIPARTGYDYNGLYTAAVGGEQVFDQYGQSQQTVDADVTLYAHWSPKSYKLQFSAGDLEWGTPVADQEVAYDGTLTTLPTPEVVGHTFLGWKLESGEFVSDGAQVLDAYKTLNVSAYPATENSQSVSLIAVYEKIKFTITFVYQGIEKENTVTTVEYGDAFSALTLPKYDTASKSLTAWSTQADTLVPCTISEITDNITLYAFWTHYKSVTLHLGGNAGVKEIQVYEGNSVDLSDYSDGVTNQHCNPVGWFASADYTGNRISSISYETAASEYYFQWAPKTYTLTFDAASAEREIAPITYTYGDSITLETLVKPGYHFDGWYTSASMAGTPITEINSLNSGNFTLYAGFSLGKYELLLNQNGGELDVTTYTVEYTKPYTLPVPTRHGFTFVGWYDAPDGGVRYTDAEGNSITGYSDYVGKALYAVWEIITYRESGIYSDTVTVKNDAVSNGPNVVVIISNFGFDYDALAAAGYRAKITVTGTVYCVDKCYVVCKLQDENGNQIAKGGDMLVDDGQTYNYSYTVSDIAVAEFSDDVIKLYFTAKANKGTFDWQNEYRISSIQLLVEFYLP